MFVEANERSFQFRKTFMLSASLIALALPLTSTMADQRVAFVAMHQGQKSVWVMDIFGQGPKRLNTGGGGAIQPRWSPDGQTLLFTRLTADPQARESLAGHLCIVNADGSKLVQLTSGPHFDSGDWSANGKSVTFLRQAAVWDHLVIDVRSKRVSKAPDGAIASSRSPDGTRFAYLRPETHFEDDHRFDIWLTTKLGQRGRRLTHYKSSMSAPKWSPDGKRLVFVVERPPGSNSGMDIQILTVSTGKVRTLMGGRRTSFEDPAWSPDGQWLCFTKTTVGTSDTTARFRQIFVIGADGTRQRQVTDRWGDHYLPQWTRDGQWILAQGPTPDGEPLGQARQSSVVLMSAHGKGSRTLPTPGLAPYDVQLSR